jgi:hypothetical protein
MQSESRAAGIRTRDPLLPKQVRYQAALQPVVTTVVELCATQPRFEGSGFVASPISLEQ